MREGFEWGVATSAFQIEGARDSRGDCTWDAFAATPGKVADGYNGDIACDHFHRRQEDIALLKNLGVNGYRFSVSWPRVIPSPDTVSEQGLQFYSDIIDGLLKEGISPLVNLHHWDIPLWMHELGGWDSPAVVAHFRFFTEQVVRTLGDRVTRWMTINEPNCLIGDGYLGSVHAPGLSVPQDRALPILANLLHAHDAASKTIRDTIPNSKITVAFTGPLWCPRDPHDPNCIEQARRKTMGLQTSSLWNFGLFLHPYLHGQWHPDTATNFGVLPALHMPNSENLDFITLNLYSGEFVDANGETVPLKPGHPVSAFNWPIVPEIAYWGPKFFKEATNRPILIGENGLASMDWKVLDGTIPDLMRVDFLDRHLHQLQRSIEDGANVIGYHHWTLLDNFEWQEGYRKRFGLVHVDFETQERTPKASYFHYKKWIAQNDNPSQSCQ